MSTSQPTTELENDVATAREQYRDSLEASIRTCIKGLGDEFEELQDEANFCPAELAQLSLSIISGAQKVRILSERLSQVTPCDVLEDDLRAANPDLDYLAAWNEACEQVAAEMKDHESAHLASRTPSQS
jgi:hypothetical protein